VADPETARDARGFADIGAYAVLGDGRGVALVAGDGDVDWWGTPALDSPPVFGALLDPSQGGRFTLRPVDPAARVSRRYVPDTNQLESTWTADSGRVVVTDSLNSGDAGALPWSELARRVDGQEGAIEMTARVAPGDGLRQWTPWIERVDQDPVMHAGSVAIGVRSSPEIDWDVHHTHVQTSFAVAAGQRRVIGLVAADADPLFLCDVSSVDDRIDVTARSWQQWSDHVDWPGEHRPEIVRSALALKTLVMAPSGAVAAAATTSLPERVGGDKNWDYRYSWIRDTVLTIDALSDLGLEEEVHAAVRWLLHAIRRNGPDLHVMYTLEGAVPTMQQLPQVPGYRASTPVQLGNRASGQMQLGVYGDLFGTISSWIRRGHLLDPRSARELAVLADRCADLWRRDDAGIWELTQNRPYTSSKMNCWRALDAAAALAEQGHLPGSGDRWRAEADVVRAWVDEHCWSTARQTYTFYAGSEDLDASVLLGASMGFERGPRMSTTIDAVTSELGAGALVYRYSRVDQEEATFLACAYWRAHALVEVGRLDEARTLLNDLQSVHSPLGLMSEMSTTAGELLGNIPQALSHLAHIQARHALRDAERAAKSGHPKEQ